MFHLIQLKNRITLQPQRKSFRSCSLMLLFCFMVVFLSHSGVEPAVARDLQQAGAGESPYSGWPIIASLDQVGNNADEVIEFTLDDCTAMRLFAIGEGSQMGMLDYGSIEAADTGQVIWQMHFFETDGWSRTRIVDRQISLPAGTYRLRFRTNDFTSFDDWQGRTPDFRFWGIALYQDMSADQPVPSCWSYADRPEDLGWSSRRLEDLAPILEESDVAALMIVTDGQVVYEWGNTANNFNAHSMRKSLLSALYGIAIHDGKIDPTLTLAELDIDDRKPLTDIEKQATVSDLLKARSGVYIPAAGEAASMKADRPLRGSHAPGTFWYYNNWDFNTLGTIFDQLSGQDNIYTAFEGWIANPIGMQDLDITRLHYDYERQSMHPYYGFRISARDLAKFGQLYLEQGVWQGEQIIPGEWIEESITPYSQTPDPGTYSGYGYMWWIAAEDFWAVPQGSYAASGYGGHTVEVLPDLNTIIVLRINTDDPGVNLLDSGKKVDRLMIPIIRASKQIQIHDPYQQAQIALSAWGILTVASIAVLIWSLVREQAAPTYVGLIWVLITFFFGPIGLLVYWISYRHPVLNKVCIPNWQRALGASLSNATGNILGMLVVIAICISFFPSSNIGPLTLLSPLLIGWLFFRAPLYASWAKQSYWVAMLRTILAEFMSTLLVIAFSLPVIMFLERHWDPYAWSMDSPLFWVKFLLAVFVGAVVTYPLNLWMSRRYLIWPFQFDTEKPTLVPSLRNAWGPLLICIAALAASIVVAG